MQKISVNCQKATVDDSSRIDMDDIRFNWRKVIVGHRRRHFFKMGTYNDVVNKETGEGKYSEDSKNFKKMHFWHS